MGQFLGWRSIFYFLAIVGVLLFLMVVFFMPETLRKKHADKLDIEKEAKKRNAMDTVRHVLAPFKPMIALLSYPNLMIITLYNAVIFGALYFMVSIMSGVRERMGVSSIIDIIDDILST